MKEVPYVSKLMTVFVVVRIRAPKDIPILISVNINSHGKKGFAGVIKLMLLRWEIILVYLGRRNIITKVHIRKRRQESQGRCDKEGRSQSDR